MPFQRAQAQFLNLLDAQDPDHQLVMQDAQGDPARQLAQLEALLTAPPSALLLQPVAFSPLLATAIHSLQAAGTRLFVFDPPQEVPDTFPKVAAILICDPFEIGQAAAQITIQALSRRASDQGLATPEGRVLELRGSDDSLWCLRFHEGFVHGLSAQPGILLVHDTPSNWTPSQVAPRLAEAVRLQKSLDVIFAHDDFIAQAAHQASLQTGTREQTLIIGLNGFAGPEGGIEMMRRHEIDATVLRPFLVDHAWTLLKQPTQPEANHQISFRPRLIQPSDLDHPDRLVPLPPKVTPVAK
jgi:ABC-type sugar transport system substrate-binding protein